MAFRIVSSDIYLPEYPWIAEDFDVYLGLSKGTSKKKFAVEKRYIASGQESAIFMATQAILKCLKQSPFSLSDIDLLIYASGTHHQSLPYDAAAVLAELKAPPSITSLDINSTCLSFLSALDYAQCVFAAKRHQRVLVVTSELGSGITLNKFKNPNLKWQPCFQTEQQHIFWRLRSSVMACTAQCLKRIMKAMNVAKLKGVAAMLILIKSLTLNT